MAAFLPSSLQKRLLRYILLRTGLLDPDALTLDSLDIALGRQNKLELRNVALRVQRIASLLNLPSEIQVVSATAQLLRITVPADLYNGAISVGLDGIRCHFSLGPAVAASHPTTTPQHRKTARRPQSPGPVFDNAQELAKSFLDDETGSEKTQIEDLYLSHHSTPLTRDSSMSDFSQSEEFGTGTALGLPGFLAAFIQGIVDRFQATLTDMLAFVVVHRIPSGEKSFDSQGGLPTLILRIAKVEVGPAVSKSGSPGTAREIHISAVSLSLKGPHDTARSTPREPLTRSATSQLAESIASQPRHSRDESLSCQRAIFESSPDRFSDQIAEGMTQSLMADPAEIRPGEDSSSWKDRQSNSVRSAISVNHWHASDLASDISASAMLDDDATLHFGQDQAFHSTHTLPDRSPNDVGRTFPVDQSVYIDTESTGSAVFPAHTRQLAQEGPEGSPSSQYFEQSPVDPAFFHSPIAEFHPTSPHFLEPRESASLPVDRSGQSSPMHPSVSQSIYQSVFVDPDLGTLPAEASPTATRETQAAVQEPCRRLPGQWDFDEDNDGGEIHTDAPATPTQVHFDALADAALLPESRSLPVTAERGDELNLSDLVPILSVDGIKVVHIQGCVPDELHSVNLVGTHLHAERMPGTFSTYAERSASVHFDPAYLRETTQSLVQLPSDSKKSPDVEVCFGKVRIEVSPSGLALAKHVALVLDKPENRSGHGTAKPPLQASPSLTLSIEFEAVDVLLLIPIAQNSLSAGIADPTPLAHCQLAGLQFSRSYTDVSPTDRISAAKCEVYIAGERIASFNDATPDTSAFSANPNPRPDLSCKITRSQARPSESHVTLVTLDTTCLKIDVDLSALDSSLDSLGGLSGILELSASVLSNESSNPRIPLSPRKKGVRFEKEQAKSTDPEVKVNAKVLGLSVKLAGAAGVIVLKSSAVKIVNRTEYIALVIDTLDMAGPRGQVPGTEQPLAMTVGGLRAEYLHKPRDPDLERLISLLTPTKNKYENDDDILLDTLMRQRRGGALLRINLDSLKATVTNFDVFREVQLLLGELSSFSAVANYLPQDERPGLLTLTRVRSLTASLPGRPVFDKVTIVCEDIDLAHIPLPSLLAIAIGRVTARAPDGSELVHGANAPALTRDAPMFMARMIGDEIEPLLRLKLFSVCLEYRPLLLKAPLSSESRVEEVVDLAASSVFDMATSYLATNKESVGQTAESKRFQIDLLLHECAVGLQHVSNSSKAIVAVETARVLATFPPRGTIRISTEIRKAFVHVIDDLEGPEVVPRRKSIAMPQAGTLARTLADRGYVAIVTIVNADVNTEITPQVEQAPTVEVGLTKPLVMIDACADSLQTMLLIFQGMVPPSPPSALLKYRTDPISVQDMVASFSGDGFEGVQDAESDSPSLLFDASDSVNIDPDDMSETDMTGSVYGRLDALSDQTYEATGQASQHLAQSLLEEDPYEMPPSPGGKRLSNNDLTRHLERQFCATAGPDAVELEPFYMTPEQIQDIGKDSTVLGAPFRWHTPRTQLQRPKDKPGKLPFNMKVQSLHLIFQLYDGYDWTGTRLAITTAVEEVEAKAVRRRYGRQESREPEDEESLIGDCLFNSIYVGIPANRDPMEIRRQINHGIDDLASESESYATSRPSQRSGEQHASTGRSRRLRLHRSKAHKIAIEVKGLSADVQVYPPSSGETENAIDVAIEKVEIFDNVPTSTWRKFMTSHHEGVEEREMGKPLVHLELLTLRPVPDLAATELSIKATVMPLRMHVDQDALDFLTRFFAFKDESAQADTAPKEEVFIQRIEVNTTHLYLDYKPKRVDYGGLRSGRYTEFKNFFILDNAHIILRHAIVYGVQGFDALHDTLNDVWMPDIRRNQLPGVLGGLAPVSSLVTIGTGLVDVVNIPVQEYKKDGRLMRSIGKGTVHFMRNTTSEIARFGAKVATGTQNVLQGAETMLTSGDAATALGRGNRRSPAHRVVRADGDTDEEDDFEAERAVSNYADQPLGVMQGIKSARRHLERDLLTARDALIAVQGEIMESQSASRAASAVARHAPTIILRPVIGATRAVGQTLMGVGNQVDRTHVRKLEDKYKKR